MGASFDVRGDPWGAVHPNYRGHQAYRDRIADVFFAAYPTLSPVALRLTATTSTSIRLTWEDHSATENRYEVQVTHAGAPSTVTLPLDTTSWEQGGLSWGTTYTYEVRACNGQGCTAWSNRVMHTTPQPPLARPAAPSNLTGRVVVLDARNGTGYRELRWLDNSNNEERFEVVYQNLDGPGSGTVTLIANNTMYQTGSLFDRTATYSFSVQACNAAGCSGPSNTVIVGPVWGPDCSSL